MDTLVYRLIARAHEANADGIATVLCFKDAARSKMRELGQCNYLVRPRCSTNLQSHPRSVIFILPERALAIS